MTAVPGRPLRALALLAITALIWFAARAPGLEERYHTAMLAVRPPTAVALAAAARAVAHEVLGLSPLRTEDGVKSVVVPKAKTITSLAAGHSRRAANTDSNLRGGAPMVASQADVTVPVPPKRVEVASSLPGFGLATQAYARLSAGDRRAADRLFGDAIAIAGETPQAADWARERRRLNRQWSVNAYALFRDAGADGSAAASPVLGGGQSGAMMAYLIDPLAQRPLAIIARFYAAHDNRNLIDGDTAQGAFGVRWQPRSGVSIAAERLVGIGRATSGDWNIRVAAGGERRIRRVMVDGYGEAGVRGNGDVYAGGQARAAVALGRLGGVAFSAGPGAWGSVQSGFTTVSRVDLGVGVIGSLPAGVAVTADWRWRVAGNAAPVSGPAVTVSFGF